MKNNTAKDFECWGMSELIEHILDLEREARKREIEIPFTAEDLEDLQHGRTFDWTFEGIEVHLYSEEY